MQYSFRQRVRRGERLLGTIVSLDSPEVVEILCSAGFDWLFLEAEHAPQSARSLQRLIMAARDVPCVVRLPNQEEIWVKRALDAGAAGILVPQVNTAEQARAIVRYAKYPPQGCRGIGIARANGYGYEVADHIAQANDATAVVVQAEHIDAVRNIRDIAAVAGLDAVLVGPYDLSASLYKTGEVHDPEVSAAIDSVAAAAAAQRLSLGIFGVSPAAVQARIDQGFTLIACGMDTLFLGQHARECLAALKQGTH